MEEAGLAAELGSQQVGPAGGRGPAVLLELGRVVEHDSVEQAVAHAVLGGLHGIGQKEAMVGDDLLVDGRPQPQVAAHAQAQVIEEGYVVIRAGLRCRDLRHDLGGGGGAHPLDLDVIFFFEGQRDFAQDRVELPARRDDDQG